MNKKELMNLGITDEQADSVLDMLKDAYVPLSRFNEINDKMKSFKSQLEEKTKENETLSSKVKDTEKLNEKIKTLEEASEKAASDHAATIASMKKSNAIDAGLRDSKAKNIKAVKALLDMDKITFENDKLEGLEDQIKALMESDNSKFMFENTPGFTPKGAQPGQASGGSASGSATSYVDAIKNALTLKK